MSVAATMPVRFLGAQPCAAVGSAVMRRTGGFSLIELLLALALGILMITGIVQLFIANNASYQLLSGQARLQENGRMALEMMARSIREAGFYGCAPAGAQLLMGLNGSGDQIFEFDLRRPLQTIAGGEGLGWYGLAGNGAIPHSDAIRGDVLVTRSLGAPQRRLARTMAPEERPVVAVENGRSPFGEGDIVMLADCRQAALFRVTGLGGSGDERVLHHDPGGSGAFENSSRVGEGLAPAQSPYGRDALIAPLTMSAFFVAPSRRALNNAGERPDALWLKQGPRAPVELMAGVERLEVRFGVDTASDEAPLRVHHYVPYAEVEDARRIVTVRLSVTVNSVDAVLDDGDGLLRRSFSETVFVRNAARPSEP